MTEPHPPLCDYEGSDYQATFWDAGGREYEDRAEAVALRRLLPAGGRLLLEVGAGAGRNTSRYAGFEQVVLLDYSRTQLQQARARLGLGGRYRYVAADAYRLPFIPGRFDAATMIRTLHHMADAPRALAQVRQVLQPGGIFILEYANKQNIKAVLRYLLRRQSWSPFSPDPVEFAALNFDFHPASIRRWLHENGFQIERQLTVSHFRMGALKRLVPTGLLVRLDSLAQLTGDLWQLSPSVFLRARAAEGNVSYPETAPAAASDGGAFQGSVLQGAFFRCPECGASPLEETPTFLTCPACSRRYAIRDGIYDFKEPV